jgi:glucan biosynthesis protein
MARDLAGKSFKAPDNKLPDNLKDLDYDRYRAIRFLPERALWRGESYLSRRNSFIADFSITIESTSMR